MEQQSTSATPSKRQDYVQYTPQIVTNYNQQFDQQQGGGLGSPSQEHYEDSMLELKDVDTLPSNYAFLSHQTIPNNPNQQQPIPVVMMHQPPQQMYMPAETQQRVYETPTNNNYIHSGMIMNPNVVPHNMTRASSSEPSSFDMNKYTTWTRVVLIFAILLGIYGCFGLVSQLIMAVSFTQQISNNGISNTIPSMIAGTILSILEIAAGAIGVWSTVTKNQKHRRNTTIAHLVLLSIVVVANIVSGIIVNVQMMYSSSAEQITSTGINPQHLVYVVVLSILFYVLLIFACCGSCIGCQAYRFRIISKLQEDTQPETIQGEGFMVMRDEV